MSARPHTFWISSPGCEYDFDPGSNVVDVYVGYLRKKLPAGMIETVRGAGYRLRSSVE